MTTMLERMRARVQERSPQFEKDFSIYAFWNLKFGGSSTLRLLPFNDPYTGGFWTEKVMLPMQFTDPNDPTHTFNAGVKGKKAAGKKLWENRDKLIGLEATVQYQNMTPDGACRFGQVYTIHFTERW